MEKYLLIAGMMIASAIAVPKMLEDKLDRSDQVASGEVQQEASGDMVASLNREKAQKINPLDGRRAVIDMNRRGHFIAEARLNGYRSKVLVDTGATLVAVNQTTARRMGIRLKDSDFKYKVNTANGVKLAARGMIDEITIGRITVKDVAVSISRDDTLDVILLGMAFLNKLRKFEVEHKQLVLFQ